MSSPPRLTVYNHQKAIKLSDELLGRLQSSGNRAVTEVLKVIKGNVAVLGKLDEVEVNLLDDVGISDIHLRFMEIPGATDVITFDHGEIHISVETAKSQAREYGNHFEQEMMLYIIHGLLHLAGYEDATDKEYALMDEMQQSILSEVW